MKHALVFAGMKKALLTGVAVPDLLQLGWRLGARSSADRIDTA